jgi:TPR repeat protein
MTSLTLKAALTVILGLFCATAAQSECRAPEEQIASCQIEGQPKQVSICLSGTDAIYRFGPQIGQPELMLKSPLMNLGFLTASGAGGTIDEIVTFLNVDYAYQLTFGFRDGLPPDPSELHKIGKVSVSRNGKSIIELTCAPDTINRVHDRLLERMRAIGRETDSNGATLSNYTIEYPGPAVGSPPCEQDFNVDTCWSRGVSAQRGGDPALALDHYDMPCDADLGPQGCYEAGKLYLQNKKLRDYARAYDRFTRVCESDDVDQGPFACKYLGWMHLTGIGAAKDADKAWAYLSQACFTHNDELMIDSEGCHFFAEAVLKTTPADQSSKNGGYLAYLALAMGCSDGAEGICAEARAFLAAETAISAPWIARCDRDLENAPPANDCAGLITLQQDYDTNQALRRQIFANFLDALEMSE